MTKIRTKELSDLVVPSGNGSKPHFNSIASPVSNGLKYAKKYVDNFASSRYLMYQLIGGSASIGTKILLPLSGILDDGGYLNQVELMGAAAFGHTIAQFPAYLFLEHRKYGQPINELAREYWAWRGLEAFVLNAPAYFMSAGQATLVEGKVGVIVGALSTSFIGPGKIFSGWLDAPIMHAIYRRLQLRKEQGIHTDGKEVYFIIRNGITTAATTIASGLYNHAIKLVK